MTKLQKKAMTELIVLKLPFVVHQVAKVFLNNVNNATKLYGVPNTTLSDR